MLGSGGVGFDPQQKGLRCRTSPTCTLSQNGYGDDSAVLRTCRRCAGAYACHVSREAGSAKSQHQITLRLAFPTFSPVVGSSSRANYLLRNAAMDDSIGGS